jgi:hypothetical protein
MQGSGSSDTLLQAAKENGGPASIMKELEII